MTTKDVWKTHTSTCRCCGESFTQRYLFQCPELPASCDWCWGACGDPHVDHEPEEQEEDYEGEARLQRWERAREEWWA